MAAYADPTNPNLTQFSLHCPIINYNNIQYENPKIHCLICVDALINSCVSLKPVTYTSNTSFLTGYN